MMLNEIMIGMAIVMGSSAHAASCDHLYPFQKRIEVKDTKELCNSWYVSRYDERNRKVIMVSEVLDAKEAVTERSQKFTEDNRVKHAVRTSEYTRIGYDRGHLAPAGDASNQKEMEESFRLTNVVPQSPKLNRGEWKKLETNIRSRSKQPVHVITGALYDDTELHGSMTVPVPYAMYKVVYFHKNTEYWYAENSDNARVVRVPRTQLEKKVGYRIP